MYPTFCWPIHLLHWLFHLNHNSFSKQRHTSWMMKTILDTNNQIWKQIPKLIWPAKSVFMQSVEYRGEGFVFTSHSSCVICCEIRWGKHGSNVYQASGSHIYMFISICESDRKISLSYMNMRSSWTSEIWPMYAIMYVFFYTLKGPLRCTCLYIFPNIICFGMATNVFCYEENNDIDHYLNFWHPCFSSFIGR